MVTRWLAQTMARIRARQVAALMRENPSPSEVRDRLAAERIRPEPAQTVPERSSPVREAAQDADDAGPQRS